jgi:hypothetical protein
MNNLAEGRKKAIKVLILVILFGLFISYLIYKDGYSALKLTLLFTSVVFAGAGLFNLWRNRNNRDLKLRWDIEIVIGSDEISFPDGYYFWVSDLSRDKKVTATRISEINLNTFPPSFVLDDKEVIFVKRDQEDQLKEFGERNHIPIVHRFDIWACIINPFLDTEFTSEENENMLAALEKNGVSREETAKTRKKISITMWANAYAWEWIYLGQFDYLMWTTILTNKKYWWTMNLALRNFRKGH